MKRLIAILMAACSVAGAVSIEFPISTAPGDQLYPDVCWDGEAFWVVWQDEELGTIRGVRVSEDGEFLTDEVEFFNKGSFQGPMCHPVVAAGRDRISAEARVMLFYNEFGSKTWGIMHNEFTFDGVPIHPYPMVLGSYDKETIHASTPCLLFGEKYFFSFHRYSKETPIDFHASSVGWSFDPEAGKAYLMWESSEVQLEFYPPTACWDGERFVVLFWGKNQLNGAFVSDSIYYKEIGEDFSWPWGIIEIPTDDLRFETKFQTLVPGGSGYFFMSQTCEGYIGADYVHGMVFYILDSTVMPVDSGRAVGFFPYITCSYPDAVFVGENFVCVWENRYLNNNTTHLYAIEVDTSGEILKSGYVVQKSPIDQHPAIAFGEEKYFLVWSDNHEGEFNVYGMLFDTLEVKESIQEHNPLPVISSPIIAKPNIFSATTTLYLSASNMDKDVVLKVYDKTGSLVRRLVLLKGERSVVWDGNDEKGRDLHSGVYFILPEGMKVSATRIIKL